MIALFVRKARPIDSLPPVFTFGFREAASDREFGLTARFELEVLR
jgi:hypothetical protein